MLNDNKNTLLLILITVLISMTYLVFAHPVTQERPMNLTLANQAPNISYVTLKNVNYSVPDEMVLEANNRSLITCYGYAYDIDGYPDLTNAYGRIWNTDNSNYAAGDDNRWHYTNDSCQVTQSSDIPDVNALVNCTFGVWFYANYSQWNCTLTINDTGDHLVNGTDNASMNRLLAIDVVNSTIEWGERAVDTDYDTDLNVSVENEGNVEMDLQLDAYNDTAVGIPGNYSFSCQIGNIPARNIVFNHSDGGVYSQSTRFSNESYINVSDFDLAPQDGTLNIPTNRSAYFGINVPGWPTINGTCTGWMRFDAVDGTP
jgi:hypothetical protein